MILIKKEKDNKLYDSSKKRYITLSQIIQYIEKGEMIKVINHQNQDITENTLLAALFYKQHLLSFDRLSIIEFIRKGLKLI